MTVRGRRDLPRHEVRSSTYRPRRSGGSGSTIRGILVVGILAAVVIGGAVFLGGPMLRNTFRDIARDNPQSMRFPFIADVIKDDLGAALSQPAGTDDTPVPFVIPEGASVARIGRDLEAEGLIAEAMVFQYLVITRNVESELQNGTFTLDRTMTPDEIVARLQEPPDPPPAQITFAPRAGLRIEQLVAKIINEQDQYEALDGQEFYEVATEPSAELLAEFEWLELLPEGATLEGFLPGGVYSLDRDITAEELVRLMLEQWYVTIGAEAIPAAEAADKDPYETIVLASIVEREVSVDAERGLVAGVYQNRLDGLADGVRLLNADPTVIYANDTMELRDLGFSQWPDYLFWSLIGQDLASFEVTEDLQSYQTYQTTGLPAGPIGSPTLASIQAAIEPDTDDGFLYFVACGDDGTHRFATSLREHNENVAECQG